MTLLTRWCSKCKEVKSIDAFGKNKANKYGLQAYCKPCSTKVSNEYQSTPIGRAKRLIKDTKKNVDGKRAYLEKTLTVKDILPALEFGKCQLTGLSFDFQSAETTHKNPYAPSLDRIDSQKGYTKENVRVVLSAVNDALGESSDDAILPILKALVIALEKNVKQKPITPVPERPDTESHNNTQLGALLTTRIGKNGNNPNYHSGTIQRQNPDHSTQEGSRDSMGTRDAEVEPPQTSFVFENYGDSKSEIVRLDFWGRRLPS
jgi:hypothetical protein